MSVLSEGYRIPFKEGPPPFKGVRHTPLVGEYAHILLDEVKALLQKNAIELVPDCQRLAGFYSTYFLIPKKTGDFRPILNLKPFNRQIVIPTFKM
jgi:hypothetical protein